MIDLYILETCPYCQKVMKYLDENNIKYNKKNIANENNLNELINLGGKEQVPFLSDRDNKKLIYESNDIIEYIKNRG